MRQLFCILLCLVLLAGCGKKEAVVNHEKEASALAPDQIDGVWMELVEGTLSPSGMTYAVHNESGGRRLTYGEDFSLQVEDDGAWYDLIADFPDGFAFPAIGYELDGETETESSKAMSWALLYGELPPGRYRMLKEMIWSGSVMTPVLALEFEVEA